MVKKRKYKRPANRQTIKKHNPAAMSQPQPPAQKTSATLLDLPDELLTIILAQVYEAMFRVPIQYCHIHRSYSCDCRSDCRSDEASEALSWFKFTLPLVHPRFFHLLAPCPQPCIQFPQYHRNNDLLERIVYMSSPSFAPMLIHTRHIRINFESLQERCYSLRCYLAHIYLICLSAFRLETLELGDLVLNAGDKNSEYGVAPYRLFEGAPPLQFDLTSSYLLKALPGIFAHLARQTESSPSWKTDALQHFLAQWHRIVKEPQDGQGGGIGFAKLKHVFLMDGNEGITIDHYANLFLIPRHLCSAPVAAIHDANPNPCNIWSHRACTGVTACPSLTSLTLVLWYDLLLIDASFLHAMLHFVHHHPKLARLNLVSRRLRFEPDSVASKLSPEEWFQYQVVPLLTLANDLFKDKVEVYIYILTNSNDDRSRIDVVIQRFQGAYPAVKVETMAVYGPYNPKDIYHTAAKVHHTLCKNDIRASLIRQQQPHGRLDSYEMLGFFS
ncbi:uncharacterized protein UTRI_04924 [Ustilago trichophora]|uniref:Uncharacterized protein n=1 Tax=Ustilago trichophora TaxID=86804 RepID=A0A5C3EFP6_9BASI|nr:uncharacterized protein UTRI_04924 [Ustilago trichophora]